MHGHALLENDVEPRHVSDEEFANLKAQFSDKEIAEPGFAIAAIRIWNLLNVSFRTPMPDKPYEA